MIINAIAHAVSDMTISDVPVYEAEIIERNFVDEMVDSIDMMGGIAEVREDRYKTMLEIVNTQSLDFEQAKAFFDRSEVEYCERHLGGGVKLKNGRINMSKSMPKDKFGDYWSAKSVILGALENGFALTDDDGELIGKSALSKARAESKKTPEEKVRHILETLEKAIKNCDDAPTMLVEVQHTVNGWML